MQEPYRSLVINGKKTVEGRLNKGKFASIKTGDILMLEQEKIQFEVIKKSIYLNFKTMIEKEGLSNVLPDKNNIKEATNVYYEFYTKEQEKEYGVLAIKIKRK